MANAKTIDVEGYVLRIADYKEHDAMVSLLTEDGLLSFSATGIRKTGSKNAPSCQLLSYSRFTLLEREGGSYKLLEGLSLRPIDGKDSLERLFVYYLIGELSSRMLSEEEATEAYPWLDACLKAMEGDFPPLSAAVIYFSALLRIAGFGLDVDACVLCGSKTDIVGLSFEEGGFLCKDDLVNESERMTPRYLKIARYLFKMGVEDASRVAFSDEEMRFFLKKLSEYLENQTGLKLRSMSLLTNI